MKTPTTQISRIDSAYRQALDEEIQRLEDLAQNWPYGSPASKQCRLAADRSRRIRCHVIAISALKK